MLKIDEIFKAVCSGNLEGVRDIVKDKKSINSIVDKNTLLQWAIKCGHANIAKFLIDAGADVNKRGAAGNTALHYAAGFQYPTLVKYLIAAGADVNVQCVAVGSTPLHSAAKRGNLVIVCMLIKAGALVNLKRSTGQTALCLAAVYGYPEVVRALLNVPGIRVNDIALPSLHSFLENNKLTSYLLRKQGVLEKRSQTNTRELEYLLHSAHTAQNNPEVAKSFADSIIRLKVGKVDRMISDAYAECVAYLKTSSFLAEVIEISNMTSWFWEQDRPDFQKAIELCTPEKRKTHLLREIPKLFERMTLSSLSADILQKFSETVGLIWLALQDAEGLGVVAGQDPTLVYREARLTFWKKVFSTQYEYYEPAANLNHSFPACAFGTIRHLLCALNGVHSAVAVTFLKAAGSGSLPDDALKLRILAQMPNLINRAYTKAFLDFVQMRLGLELLDADYTDFFKKGVLTNEEHLQCVQKVLGRLKHKLRIHHFARTLSVERTVYCILEDILKETPISEFATWVFESAGYKKAILVATSDAPILETWHGFNERQLKEHSWFRKMNVEQQTAVKRKLGTEPAVVSAPPVLVFSQSQGMVTRSMASGRVTKKSRMSPE